METTNIYFYLKNVDNSHLVWGTAERTAANSSRCDIGKVPRKGACEFGLHLGAIFGYIFQRIH